MDTPYKFIIGIIIFWLCLGGLLQLFNMNDYTDGNSINSDTESKLGSFTFIYDLMTFNIKGMPSSFRAGLTTFLSASLLLSIYVLIRGQ
jgi:hypothetical protein